MKGKGSIYDARSELAKRVGVESTSSSNSNQSYSNQQSTTQTDDWEEKIRQSYYNKYGRYPEDPEPEPEPEPWDYEREFQK